MNPILTAMAQVLLSLIQAFLEVGGSLKLATAGMHTWLFAAGLIRCPLGGQVVVHLIFGFIEVEFQMRLEGILVQPPSARCLSCVSGLF